jgi:hypothetical protein
VGQLWHGFWLEKARVAAHIWSMKKGIGYKTPQQGQADLGRSYKVWVRVPGDKKWYSPKDISGVRRNIATHEHLRVLKRVVPRLQEKRLP